MSQGFSTEKLIKLWHIYHWILNSYYSGVFKEFLMKWGSGYSIMVNSKNSTYVLILSRHRKMTWRKCTVLVTSLGGESMVNL